MVCRGVVPIGPGCGGAEVAAYEISRALASAGHAVTLISDATDDRKIAAPGVDFMAIDSRLQRLVRRLPSGFASWLVWHLVGNLTAARRAIQTLRRQSYDVVHVHGALLALQVARSGKVPVIYTEQDAPPWRCRYRYRTERVVRTLIYRLLNVAAWRAVTAVVATFGGLRDEMVQRWRLEPDRVEWIPNATDIEQFRPRNGGRPRHRFDRYCLFVGRLTPRKAPDLLIRALADTRDVTCLFAGDGPIRPRLEQLARMLGVSERVAFLGNVDTASLSELYAGADLLVLPSVSEASPLAAVEAMASGTPVLATRIAGIPALVEDYETGFLVNPGDVGGLSVAMRLLSHDRALLREMGRRAQARVAERFTWLAVTEKYLRVYRSALEADRLAVEGAQ
jgi:glycosyltransferase involved in cell wall biosynthesis